MPVIDAVKVAAFTAATVTVAIQPQSTVGAFVYLACFAGITLATSRAAMRQSRYSRWPWLLIAAAQLCWLSGDVVYTYLPVPDDVSVCDALWLGGYPLLATSMFILVRRRAPGHARAGVLDGATLTSAAAMCLWVLVVSPSVEGSAIGVSLVGVLYPLGDVILLLSLLFLSLTPGGRGRSTRLLLFGVGLMAIGDVSVSVLGDASQEAIAARFDAVFLLSNAALALALIHGDRDTDLMTAQVSESHRLHPARIMFLGAALLASPLLFVLRGTLSLEERITLGVGSFVTVTFALTRFAHAISEQRRTYEQLEYQADHDSLTMLPNRRAFLRSLNDRFPENRFALVYIDLDHFKAINDAYGHAAGDAVLVITGRRLLAAVRDGDVVARLGGDEFAIICGGPVVDVSSLALRLVECLEAPIEYEGLVLHVGASVGVAPGNEGLQPDTLVTRADQAMFAEKKARDEARRLKHGLTRQQPPLSSLA